MANKKATRLNRRKLLHADQPWRQRLEYVCACLFGSDVNVFARSIGLDSSHVYKMFIGELAVTPAMLAQVAATTNVRASWLLTGDGDMLTTSIAPAEFDPLFLPTTVNSAFTIFDAQLAKLPIQQVMPTITATAVTEVTAAHVAAAELIHKARAKERPVIVFISAPAIYAGAGIVAADFLQKRYITSVATTGCGLFADLSMAQAVNTTDLNRVTRLAANQGVGYGEAAGRWGLESHDDKKRSVFYAAHTLGVPATAHVEIGELQFHFSPAVRGAELGAAIGAATYADLLIFTDCVRRMLEHPDGVLLIVGDVPRGVHLFLQARAAVRCQTPAPFNVILVDNYIATDTDNDIQKNEGFSHKLIGAYRANLKFLLHACDAIFNGTNPYDSACTPAGVNAD